MVFQHTSCLRFCTPLSHWSRFFLVFCFPFFSSPFPLLIFFLFLFDQWCLRMLLGINWHQHVCNDEVRRLTKQPHLSASPEGNWRRPLGRPRITWMKTIQQDLKFSDLNMDDAVDLAQNRPLWRLMSTFGATHS